MAVNLFSALIKHQLYLEGLKQGSAKDFAKIGAALDKELRRQFAFIKVANMGDMNKAKFSMIQRSFKAAMWRILNAHGEEFEAWLKDFVAVDRELFQALYVEASGSTFAAFAKTPDVAAIWASATAVPMGANGILMTKFIEASRQSAVSSVLNLLNQGWVNASPVSEVMTQVLGSKELHYNDGALQRILNQTKAVTNTVMQHLSTNTNAAVASQVAAEYEWISVLDDKTTQICRSRDGKKYPYGNGPLPPAHVNCRSTVKPVGAFAGEVDYLDTFAKWAKAQPDTVLKDIFKDGEADTKKVKTLSLDEYKSKRSKIINEE